MAMTVIGFFQDFEKVLQVLKDLVANDYDPELIKLVFELDKSHSAPVNYDNTREEAPVILFKQATFGAEITEEDCFYYAQCLHQGDALLTVHIPTDPDQGRTWEDATAKNLEKFMAEGGAYDHETHRIYTNRAALTTYPQTRYMDPLGSNQIEKNRTYGSRDSLYGEVSNSTGTLLTTNYLEELEDQSDWQILNAGAVLALFDRQERKTRETIMV